MQQEKSNLDPPNANKRRLSVDITMAEDGDYLGAVAQIRRVGASTTSVSLAWDDIETAPEVFLPEKDYLAIANSVYPTQGLGVALAINPIHINRNRLPADLKMRPLDDPEVIQRFCRLLDHVFLRTPKLNLACLVIGNEIDINLGVDSRKWVQFTRFFQMTAAYARSRRKKVPVGTKITFAGLTEDYVRESAAIARYADVLMATYYPLHPDFTVKSTEQVAKDFGLLKERAKEVGKPLYLLECGCPSSVACQSSEAKQAEFVRAVFTAWDDAAQEIPHLSFTWLTDLPQRAVLDTSQDLGISISAFREYLGSLGLRTYGGRGKDKEAFLALIEEAKKRAL